MTNRDKYQLCYAEAQQILARYKSEYPVDAQNFAASSVMAIAAVVSIAAAGLSAYGMYEQGQAQKRVAEYNAKLQENSAIAARQEAEASARQIRDRADRIRGAQIVGASKSGLMLSGSVNDVMYDSAINSELDALTVIYKGERSAQTLRAQGAITRYEGETAGQLGTIGAGATLLSGATQSLGYWSQSTSMRKLNNAQPRLG